jgi:hypothetical protein
LLRNGVRVRSALGSAQDSPFWDFVVGIPWAQTLISIAVDHDARQYIQGQRPAPIVIDKQQKLVDDETFDKIVGNKKKELEQQQKKNKSSNTMMTPSQLHVLALESYLRPALLPNEQWSDVNPWRFHKRLLKWVRTEFFRAKYGLDVQGALLYHDPALKQSPQLAIAKQQQQPSGILLLWESLSSALVDSDNHTATTKTTKEAVPLLPSAALVEKAFGMIHWSTKKNNKTVKQKMQQLCESLPGGRLVALRGGGVLVADIPPDTSLQGIPLEYVLELVGGHVAFCGPLNALCEERNIYQLWTREYVQRLASYLLERTKDGHHDNDMSLLGRETVIIDMGAGDGLLAEQLQLAMRKELMANAANDKRRSATKNVPTIVSVDNGSWRIRPRATVEKLSVQEALAKYATQRSHSKGTGEQQSLPQQTIVLCSWMPMGVDWTALFRQYEVDEYILIGECDDGTCGDNWSTWGNEKYISDDVVEQEFAQSFSDNATIDSNREEEDSTRTPPSTPPPYRVDGYERIEKPSWAPFQFSRFDSSISKTGKTVVFRREKNRK